MSLMSFGSAMRWHATQDPERVAIVFGDRGLACKELDASSNRLARAYQERGVRAGDLVTIALPNSIEFFQASLAIWKLGATPNPISARLPDRERREIVELANPKLLVGAEPGSYGEYPTLPIAFQPDPGTASDPLPDCTARYVRAMTSGGSTGRPKIIIEKTAAECDPTIAENDMRVGGTTLVPGPLHHSGPFITAWQTLLSGGSIVLMSRFDPEECLRLIQGHRIDWVLFVPTMMQRIWRLPPETRNAYDLSSLRIVMCSGAASPTWLKRAWIEWLGPERIHEAYGASERIGGTRISGTEWLAHPGSVGKPTEGRKIRIVDEEGKDCPPGVIGELYMLPPKGQGTTYQYIGAQAQADSGGWESLGDMGYFDEDGYLYLVDRKTDMIVTGGANVYPAEVEAAIDAHPNVRSSAVIGLPDDDLGQRVHAIVDATPAPSEEELRQHLRDRLGRYKIPRSFEFVSEPLRDDAGKVRRSALREQRLGPSGSQ